MVTGNGFLLGGKENLRWNLISLYESSSEQKRGHVNQKLPGLPKFWGGCAKQNKKYSWSLLND